MIARYRWPADKGVGAIWTDLDPAGELLVASGGAFAGGTANHLEVAGARTGAVAWSYDVEGDARIGMSFFSLRRRAGDRGRVLAQPRLRTPG